jgi:hypothetical protein
MAYAIRKLKQSTTCSFHALLLTCSFHALLLGNYGFTCCTSTMTSYLYFKKLPLMLGGYWLRINGMVNGQVLKELNSIVILGAWIHGITGIGVCSMYGHQICRILFY